jgi:phytoene dehydrogenase-like protein
METYDAIFIGSGHNALIAAAYLARAGWSVLVLERNDQPGGLVRTEELTLPGFQHDTFSSAHPLFVSGPAYAELGPELTARGLRYANTDLPTGVSMPDGRTAVYSRDAAANAAEADRLSPGDGATWTELMGEFFQKAGVIFPLFAQDLTSPEARQGIRSLMLAREGAGLSPFAAEFLLSARDVLERFRSEVWKAMIAPWVLHLGRGPEDANGGFWVPTTFAALEGGGMPIPVGGSGMLARALARLVRDHGGVIRTGAEAERIILEGNRAAGVRIKGGEVFAARQAVIANANPDQIYLKLLAGSPAVSTEVKRQAERYRYGRGAVQIQLAVSEPLRWPDARMGRGGQHHLTSGLDGISRSVNEAARGLLPEEPTISIDSPTVLDPSRAPAGKAIVRLQILDVPRQLRGDAAGKIRVGDDGAWTEEVKERFADRVIDLADRHLPKLKQTILAKHVVSPAEIARFNPNSGGGDPFGGAHDLAQNYMLGPIAGQPSHQTAVPGLLALGASTWPGHGVNGGSGYIVAKRLLNMTR